MPQTHRLPDQPQTLNLWIDGAPAEASGGETIDRRSPGHDRLVTRVASATSGDVDRAVGAARRAFAEGSWPWSSAGERSAVLLDVAERLEAETEDLAFRETLESGKPIAQARDEIGWSVELWRYAAALARHLYGDSSNNLGPGKVAMTLRDPIGVVGLITPWNFPLLIISQKLPFALAAGCTCVIKPSELTSSTTLRLAEILDEAGLPAGVVNVVTGYGDPVGQRIAGHPDIDMVSFTGSTRVGKGIVAASAGNLKKVSLELGGKNPLIILGDADLDAAVDAARLGAFFNMGECCNSSSRFLVEESVADAFAGRFVEAAQGLTVGDPLDEQTKLGPIINDAQMDKILGYIESGRQSGAAVVLGGRRLQGKAGRFMETTVLDRVAADSAVAREEIFGPVASIIRVADAQEAVRVANDTEYGLSAGVFTRDHDTAMTVSRRLRAGTVWVNTWLEGHSELPFGGYRQSGLGRELGRHAVEEFTEAKTVQFHLGKREPWW